MVKNRVLMIFSFVILVLSTPAQGIAKDGILIPFIITTSVTEPFSITTSYATVGLSWVLSPAPPRQDTRQAMLRAQFIHNNHRTLIEELSLGGGRTVQELVGYYSKQTTTQDKIVMELRRDRRAFIHALGTGSFDAARRFEHRCQSIAKALKKGSRQ